MLAATSAQEIAAPAPHVRGEEGMQRLIDDAARRSPAIRESIDRLQSFNVIVYVRTRVFSDSELEGRIALLSTAGPIRYLVIELACGRSQLSQMTTLAHELYHAIEIAGAPTAVTANTVADLYSRIGVKTSDSHGQRTFETEAAAAAGSLAHRQLLVSTKRVNGT